MTTASEPALAVAGDAEPADPRLGVRPDRGSVGDQVALGVGAEHGPHHPSHVLDGQLLVTDPDELLADPQDRGVARLAVQVGGLGIHQGTQEFHQFHTGSSARRVPTLNARDGTGDQTPAGPRWWIRRTWDSTAAPASALGPPDVTASGRWSIPDSAASVAAVESATAARS